MEEKSKMSKLENIAFGTSRLHHISTSKKRQELINIAFSYGIKHIDTSPYYGFGISENEIGKFINSINRSEIFIATKIGLYPSNKNDKNYFDFVKRKTISLFNKSITRPIKNFSKELIEVSLNKSLKTFNSTYIDLVHLHDPINIDSSIENALNYLNKLKTEKIIRNIGITGKWQKIFEIIEKTGFKFDYIQSQLIPEKELKLLKSISPNSKYIAYGLKKYWLKNKRNIMSYPEFIKYTLNKNNFDKILFSTTSLKHIRELNF